MRKGVVLFIDMDGVIYRDKQPIEGALDFLRWADESSIPYTLVTNNSYYSSEELSERLRKRGIPLSDDKLLTSVNATQIYLRKRYENPMDIRAFIIGSPGLHKAVSSLGFHVMREEEIWENPETLNLLVVGYDRSLTYNKLAAACLALNTGDPHYVATNSDLTFPTPKGLIPGAGSTLKFLEACSGKKPVVIGKPNSLMGEIALSLLERRLGKDERIREVWVIGDRLESDMAFAENLRRSFSERGIEVKSVLVLTGVTKEAPKSSPWRIDLVLKSIAQLRDVLEKEGAIHV